MPSGKRYTIMAVDYFTKWVEAKSLTRQDHDEVHQFLKEIFTRFGVPRVLVTDNGNQFRAGKNEDLCLELDIEHRTTSVSLSPSQWTGGSDEPGNLQGRQEKGSRKKEAIGTRSFQW
ncbi:hypothetical protein LIER_32785 [Lithospermum erythrorhizon]|uniref:Integrase catalytic domain-containing protein n=1 Tax=Lithospermum erythrorhizon TaxID=34254 RepID=A0AAV3RW66_LITER